MKLKHPVIIGGHLYPKATEVELVDIHDERLLAKFPNIKLCPSSNQVAVIFPDRDSVSIVHHTEFE